MGGNKKTNEYIGEIGVTKLLNSKFGNKFELVESFEYNYSNPSGDPRRYIYTLFKRIN